MWSTRARLAVTYAGLLFATLVVFSIFVVVARRTSARQELSAHASRAADRVLVELMAARRAGRELTAFDTLAQADTLTDTSRVTVRARPALREALEPLPGYFLVLDYRSRLLYSSFAVRLLPTSDQATLSVAAANLNPSGGDTLVALNDDAVRGLVMAARESPTLSPIAHVIAGVPISEAEVAPELLAGTLFLLAPLLLLVSVAVAYALTGNTFKPIDHLINEVEAITDGRSLHRRVPSGEADEELARLAETLNRMIERLQSSFGALRRFTADASHELKTPLTVVRADIERAMHPGSASEERMEALEEAMQEVARMSDLVDSLLTLARADEGRFDLHREPLQMEPLARDVFETAVILGEAAGVSVAMPLVEDAVVQGDATRLRQLFLNLITNAIKYTPRGGHVEITLSLRNNDEVGFAVRDTGVGIAAADLPHVFDRFWRADRARSRRPADARGAESSGGYGLGLAIAHWIAQAHGGSLTAQSRLGRGSIFTVLLPVVRGPEALSPPVPAA